MELFNIPNTTTQFSVAMELSTSDYSVYTPNFFGPGEIPWELYVQADSCPAVGQSNSPERI